MSKENLIKLKNAYRVWVEDVESWSRHSKFINTATTKVEEREVVAVLPHTAAAYIGETIRQIIDSEEGA